MQDGVGEHVSYMGYDSSDVYCWSEVDENAQHDVTAALSLAVNEVWLAVTTTTAAFTA